MTQKQVVAIRDKMGLTQAQFAERLRVSRNSVARMEVGLQVITPAMALLISYVAREAGVDIANRARGRGAVEDKAAHGSGPGASRGHGRKVVQVSPKRR